jgi:phospholipid transport system substrate-binding protein
MTRKGCCALLLTVLSLAPLGPFGAHAAMGGEPTERVRSVVDQLYRLASSPATTAKERRQRDVAAAQVMDPVFEWQTMARLTLRQYWDKRTPAERDEFTRLFAELFRQAYLTRLSLVDANAFRYAGDTITGEQATVSTQVVTKRGSAIGITYGLLRVDGRGWCVQDVRVEGMSLLDNYRDQFTAIIARSSYEALVERLRSRTREHGSGASASRPPARQGASRS